MNLLTLFPLFSGWASLALRLVVTAIFFAHGWPKIKNLKQNAVGFGMMGFKPGAFWGTLVAFTEVFGGLAVLLGVFTQFVTFPLVIDMIVATFFKIRKGMKLRDGFELDLLLIGALLVIATAGPGFLSLQSYFGW